ncbi:LysR substrate-binding domain-containing protein [Pseudoroseicyclus sp. CXY001]|uniref:LysR substrate-binding domain-containing protein n=1 Tax=Pseudoroseicyclus sp. CXY001 TaxID=3242492 RepID=UPI00358DB19D
MRYFLAVAEQLNFGRAAEQLGIAQPNLSQQIKALEEIVGAQLFNRTQRHVKLTAAGELFSQEARAALDHAGAALAKAQRAGRGELGRIAVGYVGSASYTGALIDILSAFRESYPDVEIDLHELEMQEQLPRIAAGTLDIGFIRPPVEMPLGVGASLILREELVLALPERHPRAEGETVALADLRGESFLTPHHGAGVSFTQYTRQACEAAGFSPTFGRQAADFVTILSLVGIGFGVALVPASCQVLRLPGVRYLQLAGAEVRASLSLASRRSEPSPLVHAFLQQGALYRAEHRRKTD